MSSQIGVGSSSTLEEDGTAAPPGARRSRPGQHRQARRRRDRTQRRPTGRHERPGPRRPRALAGQRPDGHQQDRDAGRASRRTAPPGSARRGAVRRRRLWLAALACGAAVAVALLLQGTAPDTTAPGPVGTAGEPGDGGAPTGSVTSQRQSQTDDELARYWTPERRAQAVNGDVANRAAPAPDRAGTPADTPGGPASPAASGAGSADLLPPVDAHLDAPAPAASLPGVAVPGRLPLAGNAVVPYHDGGLAARAEGALFSAIGGIDYACSGTVVDSPGGDLVVTAGHCLHEGAAAGGFASNVIFIPGYAGGATPYGVWHARQLTVTNAWGYQQDFDQDAGFAAFRPVGGQELQAVVGGGFPLGFGTGRQPQTVLGYPKLPPYDGTTLMYCSDAPAPDPHGGTSLGVRCAMTAGASGGAWFTGFAGGAGTVDSVVSYAYTSDPGTIYGTWFGPAIQSLYQHAIGL